MELATVFAKLDTDVTIVEMLDSILPTYDDDLTKPVRDRADTLGIDFRFGESAINWSETNEGIVVTTENEIGDRYEYHTQKMLVAVGRESVTNTVNLEAAEIQPDDNGFIPTDRQQRTEQDHIFAVGDVTGDPMLAHKASAEGIIAAEVAAGEDKSFNHASIPAAVFTEPEIASVGMTAEEATNSGFSPISGKFPFRANGRALTANHEEGFVRVVADEDSNLLLGAQIVGPEASELIGELGLAIETGATLHDIVGTIHTHPTLSEAVKEAAEHALGQSIHTINR
jgi:dihydrolipoamide dehydrogenase